MKASRITPPTIAATVSLAFGVEFWMKLRIASMEVPQLDLGVEDVGVGLDGLVADLRGKLHREACALDRHHDRARVGRLAGGERLRGVRGLGLEAVERLDRVLERTAEAVRALGGLRAVLDAADAADAADAPLGAGRGQVVHADRRDGRQQRRRASVGENRVLADCMAVTFAS